MKSIDYTLKNEEGLHARPATEFVEMAMKFKSKISVMKDEESFSAKSIVSVLSIGACKGDKITVVAEGEDEEEAVAELVKVMDSVCKQ